MRKNKYPPMPSLSSSSAANQQQPSSKKKRKLSSTTGIDMIAPPKNDAESTNKYNLRYDPDEPMTEEQKAEWRKEQRKARNRASAAASRNKTRARIQELESEVDSLKSMYAAAIKRIAELESGAGVPPSAAFAPASPAASSPLRTTSVTVSPPSSPPLSPVSSASTTDVSIPPLECTIAQHAPLTSPSISSPSHDDLHGKQHVIENHSQPA